MKEKSFEAFTAYYYTSTTKNRKITHTLEVVVECFKTIDIELHSFRAYVYFLAVRCRSINSLFSFILVLFSPNSMPRI